MRLLHRRHLVALILVITVGPAWSSAGERPNVLLIVTDDQGYGDLSIHGNPYVSTPNIDSLARDGVRFDRFYTSTFCAPTRAGLLTGRYPLRCGVWGVTLNKETMRSEEVTLAEALQQAGYHTACIGKWHNGEQYPFTPPGQGFDEFVGFCNGHTNNYFDALLQRGSVPEQTQGYITDVLTDEAIRFITLRRSRPFFCSLSYNAPHSPFQVSDQYFEKFAAKGFSAAASAFYGMCENIDDNVGRVLQALKDNGLHDNTIVVFLTDNGGTTVTGIHNAGMRGGKTSVHEGGSRVPLFIRWPARFNETRIIYQIASHIDLYPTLLELCGVPQPENQPALDGTSLVPLMERRDDDWPDRILFTHNPISERNRYPGAVRTQRYRLVREIDGAAGGSAAVENDRSASPWQLYDMHVDPAEEHDLAGELPELVEESRQKYESWLDDVASEGLQRFPIPVGHSQENPVTLHAHQAYFDALRFSAGAGYAHDYLTHWSDVAASVWFDIEVQQPGEYFVTLIYGCSAENAGSNISVGVGNANVEARIVEAPAPIIPLPHRDAEGHTQLVIRDWGRLCVGKLQLNDSTNRLTLRAIDRQGQYVMDFKGIELKRLD